jgi:TRAP-type C4-dicarboxylate transport system permease small subunit
MGLVLLIYGAQLAWLVRENTIPSLGISRAVAYVPLPVAGLLMALFALPQMIDGRPRGEEMDS